MSRIASCLVFALLATPAPAQTKSARLPEFAAVEQQVQQSFFRGAVKDHQATDLISRGQVEPLFKELAKLGWDVADREEILADVLADGGVLVKKLRTKNGKKFMRQSAAFASAYDRLDHLARLSDGPRILDRLIAGPDGYKMIDYLATTTGGKNMGKMLDQAPGGKKFNQSTGRIYTQEQLLARLRESHAQALRAATATP